MVPAAKKQKQIKQPILILKNALGFSEKLPDFHEVLLWKKSLNTAKYFKQKYYSIFAQILKEQRPQTALKW